MVRTEPDLMRTDVHRGTAEPSTSASKSGPVNAATVSTWKRRDGPARHACTSRMRLRLWECLLREQAHSSATKAADQEIGRTLSPSQWTSGLKAFSRYQTECYGKPGDD